MKNINFKTLARGMSFEDMAILMFKDVNLKNSSGGNNCLLNPGEEEALLKECRKRGDIPSLNKLIDIFNLTRLAIADVQMSIVSLDLAISRIEAYVLMLYLQDSSVLTMGENAGVCSLFVGDDGEGSFPDEGLQLFFVNFIDAVKKLKSTLYLVQYAENLAGIDFVSDEDRCVLSSGKEKLEEVEVLPNLLAVIRVFKPFLEAGELKREGFVDKKIIQLIGQDKTVFEISEEEKKRLEEKLDRLIEGRPPLT